jgi:hypothetical protein
MLSSDDDISCVFVIQLFFLTVTTYMRPLTLKIF